MSEEITPKTSFWRTVRESLSGKEQDFTTGSIKKAILLLSVPMILEMLGESIFAIVDIYFVGKVSTQAVATVILTEFMMTILYSVAFGMAMAATAMIARRVGEKDHEAASVAAVQAIRMGVMLSIIIALIGLFFSRELLQLMGASKEVIASGSGYTQWMLGGNIVIMLIFINNAIFRGAGNAFFAMKVLLLANGLNIILDPILILGLGPIPGFGVEGAAYATNIGRGVGVIYQIYYMAKGTGNFRIARRHLAVKWDIIRRLIDRSSTGAGQFIIASASWLFLANIMTQFGDEAVAGYGIAIRVLLFTIFPAWGMANAAATLVGQNLGAQRPDRAERAVWLTALYDMIFLGVVSVVYFLTAEWVIGIFTSDPAALAHGVEALKYICLGYVFFAYGMVIAQAFNGAGDTRTPTLLNFVGFWLVQVPLAYALAIWMNMETIGVYLAIIISESFLAMLAVYTFRLGRWKKTEI